MGWFMHHLHTRPKASGSIGARRLLSESGFSLTEVMAAVVVFSCGLVGLGSMQIAAIKLNAGAHITTQMATLGQEQMEKLLALPFTAPVLQDNAVAVGQGTTYCVLYPPEGIRPCTEEFTSSYPPPAGSTYCPVIAQPSGGV
jgi:prepilin-type N-terminal cleavage/methylation domain-containing protein